MKRRTRLAVPLLALLLLGACASEEAAPTPTVAAGFLAAPPSTLDSYRYSVAVTMSSEALDTSEAPSGLGLDGDIEITSTGEVVNPDRERSTSTVNLGFLSLALETVRIGEQEWTRQDQGPWQATTAGQDGAITILGGTNFSPAFLFETGEGYSYEDLTQRLVDHGWTDEEVNGIAARRFTFTEEEFYATFQPEQTIIPADIEASIVADLWIAEDLGVPVQMAILGTTPDGATAVEIEMALTDLNDESIEVTSPV